MSSALLAAAGAVTTVLGGIAGYNQNKANAEMAHVRSLAKRDAIERQIDDLMRTQRETLGTARSVMAKSSGYGQDQTIMLEGMTMNRMARDMAELKYSQDMTGIEGDYQTAYFKSAATASLVGAGVKSGAQAYQGYMAYRDAH